MAGPSSKLIIPPISAAGPGTLYRQIIDGLKREVSEGRLAPGPARVRLGKRPPNARHQLSNIRCVLLLLLLLL